MRKIYSTLLALMFTSLPALSSELVPASIRKVLKHSVDVNYLSVILALGIVILLIYITGIIYAKLNVIGQNTAKKQYRSIGNSRINVQSTTPIGPNKSLHVIEYAGKKMLIGSTNESITLIKDLDENCKDKNSAEDMQSMLTKELSNALPLDKIYPQGEESYKTDEIEIESNIPNQEYINDNPDYNTEDFGLYKKYLND